MILTLLAVTALFLAFSNGANDNFKGFATVWGSASLPYRTALLLSNAATLAGGFLSIILAEGLIRQFSGRGLVADAVAASGPFAFSVAGGAGLTVLLATRLGFPISTTHAIVGSLIGSALSSNAHIAFGHLGVQFILPLISSPMIAALLGYCVFVFASKIKPDKQCLCIVAPEPVHSHGTLAYRALIPVPMLGSEAECRVHGTAATRVPLTAVLNRAHIFSASAICFARALNDTPKLSALLLGTGMMSGWNSALAVTLMMVAGGFLLSSRVAETMGMKLSDISSAQGTTANLVTSIVVLSASACALPVSTTHVSVGSIIGAGKAANTLHLPTVRNVLLSWVVTLPVAMIGAALLLQLVQVL